MGYYNLPSAKLPPGPRTPLDDALHLIKNLESLEVMSKLLYNAATSPKDDKFRRIRLSNPKIYSALVEVPGCLDALREMGWETDPSDPDTLIISAGKFMSMAEVRKIEDSKDRVRKLLAEEAKERLRRNQRSSQTTTGSAAAASAAVQVQA